MRGNDGESQTPVSHFYRTAGLSVKAQTGKAAGARLSAANPPTAPLERSLDFVHDGPAKRTRGACAGVVDAFTHEYLAPDAETRFALTRAAHVLDAIIARPATTVAYGEVNSLRGDFLSWSVDWKLQPAYIQPGKNRVQRRASAQQPWRESFRYACAPSPTLRSAARSSHPNLGRSKMLYERVGNLRRHNSPGFFASWDRDRRLSLSEDGDLLTISGRE